MKSEEKKETYIEIQTDYGVIDIKLYDETPLHRDNFIKLIEEGFYQNQRLHRIIKDFMIQGGEPFSSRTAILYDNADTTDYDYTIEPEIIYPQYFHKRGVLAAARMGDNVNPKKESSATQFYIVTGTVFTDAELNMMEKQRFERLKQNILADLNNDNKDLVKEYYRNGEKEKLTELRASFISQADSIAINRKSEIQFSPQQREIYKTEGGSPHLDGEYTVFGEVISGQQVIDCIQDVKTNMSDRPEKEVRIKICFKNKSEKN